jgi:hypothetical protein
MGSLQLILWRRSKANKIEQISLRGWDKFSVSFLLKDQGFLMARIKLPFAQPFFSTIVFWDIRQDHIPGRRLE